jgi:hypothetical protein
VRDEDADQLFVPPHDRHVQRGEAGRGRVMSAPRSSRNFTSSLQPECAASTVALTPCIGLDVGARGDEERGRLEVADARREHQGGVAAVRNRAAAQAARAAARPPAQTAERARTSAP